jgi:glutathione S-transferase
MDLVSFGDYPNVSRWFDAIESRDAVKEGIERVDGETA